MKSKKLFVIIALMLTFTTTISASSSLKQIKVFIHNDLTVVLNKEVFINNPVIYNNTTGLSTLNWTTFMRGSA